MGLVHDGDREDYRALILSLLCAVQLVGIKHVLSPIHPTPQGDIRIPGGPQGHRSAYIPGAF